MEYVAIKLKVITTIIVRIYMLTKLFRFGILA